MTLVKKLFIIFLAFLIFNKASAGYGMEAKCGKIVENTYTVKASSFQTNGILTQSTASDKQSIIIISGSGSLDHDGNSLPLIKTDFYREIARDLACEGFEVFRYDNEKSKLGIGNGPIGLNFELRRVDSLIEYSLKQARSKCVWLAGHSFGGILAIILSKNDNEKICGIILMATPARTFPEIIQHQLKAPVFRGVYDKEINELYTKIRLNEAIDYSKISPNLKRIYSKHTVNLISDLYRFHPATEVGKLKKPVLILQGGLDIQIPLSEAQVFAEANGRASVVVFDDLSHYFQKVKSLSLSDQFIALNSNDETPIAVTNAIASFINRFRIE